MKTLATLLNALYNKELSQQKMLRIAAQHIAGTPAGYWDGFGVIPTIAEWLVHPASGSKVCCLVSGQATLSEWRTRNDGVERTSTPADIGLITRFLESISYDCEIKYTDWDRDEQSHVCVLRRENGVWELTTRFKVVATVWYDEGLETRTHTTWVWYKDPADERKALEAAEVELREYCRRRGLHPRGMRLEGYGTRQVRTFGFGL